MPEGDTVFLAGKRLDEALSGQQLLSGELRHPRLSTVELAGHTVLGVHSVGKHLLTRFDDGNSLHSHFRMDGSWHLYQPGQRWRGPGHQVRAVLTTARQVAVGFRLHDLALLPTSREDQLVGHLGPDLLDPQWNAELEAEAVRRLERLAPQEIGTALMDQTALAGVGNLYKTEICFLLGVSPWTLVSEVDVRAAVRLARKLLAANAWHPEQSTTGHRGDRQHWVYERTRRGCLRCGGPVRTAAQRSPGRVALPRVAYFCPHCQPGPTPGPPRSG